MKRARLSVAVVAAVLVTVGPAFADPATPVGVVACSGCHPARDGADSALPKLAGRKPAEIVDAMRAFRTGQRPATVMDRIAKGFSDVQIQAIADWYAAQ